MAEITDAELAELEQLRQDAKARDAAAGTATGDQPGPQAPATHVVHLANGETVEGSTVGTHHTYKDGRVVPVIAAYPKE